MAYTEEDLYAMSDEELQKAFREAKAEGQSPDLGAEEEEDLEQPDEDSEHDTSSDEEEEFEVDEESETDEGDPDEETESEEDKTEKTESESDEEEQPVQKRKYKANGREFEFTDDEIFNQFGQVFGQAMDYTRKMQQIKPWRKTIDAIEEAKLSHDDVTLAIDVLRGDKAAIAAVLKRTGVDALEIDTDNNSYVPKDYGRNDTELAIKEIVEEISGDPEYAITYDLLEKQWDEKTRIEFAKNPDMIRQLHIDVKSGMFDTIAPIMHKMKVYDGGRASDLDYYKMAAQQYFNEQADMEARLNAQEARQSKAVEEQAKREKVATVKSEQAKREATKTASVKRKAAAPTGKIGGSKSVVDYLDSNDEAFDDWYKKLQDSM